MFVALLSTLLQAATAPAPTLDQDIRCLALYAAAGSGLQGEQLQGTQMAAIYYVGRIDAQRPGFDYEAALVELLADSNAMQALQRDLPRCSAEMLSRGQQLQNLGRALIRRGEK